MYPNRQRLVYSPVFPFLLASLLLLLMFFSPPEAAVRDALRMCASVLIPSLFPFSVISSLMVALRYTDYIGRPLQRFTEKVFRLPGCASGAFLLGALCGFPIGAKSACELYEKGEISASDAERLIALSSNAGPAFLFEVVGFHFWNSRGFGIFLYIVQLFFSLLLGAFSARGLSRSKKKPQTVSTKDKPSVSFFSLFSRAVYSASQNTLSICGFVVFFAALLSQLKKFLEVCGCSSLYPLLCALFEFSGGSAEAASVGGLYGAFLAGLSVGWSGISVFAQCRYLIGSHPIRLRFALLSKFLQGILCGLSGILWQMFFYHAPTYPCSSFSSPAFPEYALYGEILLLILFCFLPLSFCKEKKTR